MSLSDALGRAAAGAARVLTKDATLVQSGLSYAVRASRQRESRPARAGHTGGAYDALLRLHGVDLEVEPVQNGVITLDGADWIIWTVRPSPAGGSRFLECMAAPDEEVTPLTPAETDDGGGGATIADTAGTPFLAKVRAISDEKALTADRDGLIGRLIILWPAASGEIQIGAGVQVRGLDYTVQEVGPSDKNPDWRRAMLARAR